MPLSIFLKEYIGFIIIIIWIIFETFITIFRKGSLHYGNCFCNLLIGLSFLLFLFLAFLLNYLNFGSITTHPMLAAIFAILGFLLSLSGFGLRILSLKTLGHWFTPNITLQNNQVLIQKGIYKLIRHPSYTGVLSLYFGISFLLSNWVLFIFALTCFPFIYILRIRIEEKNLIERFSKDYIYYQKRTKKIIPFIYWKIFYHDYSIGRLLI